MTGPFLFQTPTYSNFLLLYFVSIKESATELNEIFEAAMTELGRRPDKLPKN